MSKHTENSMQLETAEAVLVSKINLRFELKKWCCFRQKNIWRKMIIELSLPKRYNTHMHEMLQLRSAVVFKLSMQ